MVIALNTFCFALKIMHVNILAKKETPHVNFLKILYNFEALVFRFFFCFVFFVFCFVFLIYCFSLQVISERFSGKYWTLNILSVFSGYRHYLSIEK